VGVCVFVLVQLCVTESVCLWGIKLSGEGFIQDFISRVWEMFGLASHLWLKDKSVSVTQLNCVHGQTLWQFDGSLTAFLYIFFFQSEKDCLQGSSSKVCSPWELSHCASGYKKKCFLCTYKHSKVTWI